MDVVPPDSCRIGDVEVRPKQRNYRVHYLLLHYGYAFLVIGLALEGDATLVAAALLAGQSYFDLRWVVGLGVLVTVAVNELLYELGSAGACQRWFAASNAVRIKPWLQGGGGGATLLFSRFLWGARLLIPFAAGVTHVPRQRFVSYNILGGVFWSVALVYFGYAIQAAFGTLRHNLLHFMPNLAVTLFLLGIAVGIGSIPRQLSRRHQRKPRFSLLGVRHLWSHHPAAAPSPSPIPAPSHSRRQRRKLHERG